MLCDAGIAQEIAPARLLWLFVCVQYTPSTQTLTALLELSEKQLADMPSADVVLVLRTLAAMKTKPQPLLMLTVKELGARAAGDELSAEDIKAAAQACNALGERQPASVWKRARGP